LKKRTEQTWTHLGGEGYTLSVVRGKRKKAGGDRAGLNRKIFALRIERRTRLGSEKREGEVSCRNTRPKKNHIHYSFVLENATALQCRKSVRSQRENRKEGGSFAAREIEKPQGASPTPKRGKSAFIGESLCKGKEKRGLRRKGHGSEESQSPSRRVRLKLPKKKTLSKKGFSSAWRVSRLAREKRSARW